MNSHFHIDIKHSDILVVDDNAINLSVLTTVLAKQGYAVRKAVNGLRALEEIEQKKPDLVLLDVQMPDMDGIEVCRRLKASEKTEDIPVIFITATDTVEGKVAGFEAGGVDYISRPLQMPEVLARVRNHLMLRKLQQDSDAENDRLEKILEALPIGYLISTIAEGTILEINDSACQTLGISQEDVSKYKSVDFYADAQQRSDLIELVKQKCRITNQEIRLKNSTGEPFTSLFSATPMKFNGVDSLFVTFLDISERKKMELELESLATTDYLTGTLNRRAFTERAIVERQRANRNKLPISMAFFDIDHFKKINDTYGHDVGDIALKELVRIINECLRTTDIFGRLGGEEFAILLPETALEGALILSDRIRERVSEEVIKPTKDISFSMTISGGLALWDEGLAYDGLFKMVDERLYIAKNSGRNKVVSTDS